MEGGRSGLRAWALGGGGFAQSNELLSLAFDPNTKNSTPTRKKNILATFLQLEKRGLPACLLFCFVAVAAWRSVLAQYVRAESQAICTAVHHLAVDCEKWDVVLCVLTLAPRHLHPAFELGRLSAPEIKALD